jgi:vanillate O-demethylase monooxygenase subunit
MNGMLLVVLTKSQTNLLVGKFAMRPWSFSGGLKMLCLRSKPGHNVRGFEPVKSFPVIERYGFVWVWPGDASKADPNKMPVFEWFENPAWAYGGGHYHIACDYRLMIDNLMDLTHETYVHATSIGQTEIDETPSRTVTEGNSVITSRFMEGINAPPFWQMAMRANDLPDDAKVDRWQICRFSPPSHVMIEVGVALAGKGGYSAAPKDKAYSVVVDFITPFARGRAKFSVKTWRCLSVNKRIFWPIQSAN